MSKNEGNASDKAAAGGVQAGNTAVPAAKKGRMARILDTIAKYTFSRRIFPASAAAASWSWTVIICAGSVPAPCAPLSIAVIYAAERERKIYAAIAAADAAFAVRLRHITIRAAAKSWCMPSNSAMQFMQPMPWRRILPRCAILLPAWM